MSKSKEGKKPPKRISHYKRQIHIGDEVWTYQVKGEFIAIKDPKGEKFLINMSKFTGWSWDELERFAWKSDGVKIKPSHIKKWVEAHKAGEEPPEFDSYGFIWQERKG